MHEQEQDNNLEEELKNPLLYYYKWSIKYSNGEEVHHFLSLDDFKKNKVNKFGELNFKSIVQISLLPLREGLKPIVIDLQPFKHATYKKPIYWRRRVFCSDNSYPPFHVYIVGYEVNIDGKVLSLSVCVYPDGTVEVTDKEPQSIDLFITNLKNSLGGKNGS